MSNWFTKLFTDPTPTVEQFVAVYQICQNLATMQNNMRKNVQIIQTSNRAGQLQVPVDKVLNDLGKAFQQRLSMNSEATVAIEAQVNAQALKMGVDPDDITALTNVLQAAADGLATTTASDTESIDALVTDILTNVPAARLPF